MQVWLAGSPGQTACVGGGGVRVSTFASSTAAGRVGTFTVCELVCARIALAFWRVLGLLLSAPRPTRRKRQSAVRANGAVVG